MSVIAKLFFWLALVLAFHVAVQGQQIVDPCFASIEPLGRYENSEDLVNLCSSCISNSIASDLLEWDGAVWLGQLAYTFIDLPPPTGCSVRAIWMGYRHWTSSGEAFGLRLSSPLIRGQSYTFKFTYASDGIGSDGNFNPMVYTSKSTPMVYEWNYVGRLPPAGNSWKTDSITITSQTDGDEWIILRAYESSGIVLSNCSVTITSKDFLVSDTTLCEGNSLRLNAITGKYYTYLWNTGAKTSSIPVHETGLYTVEVTNYKCISYDSSNVLFEDCEVRLDMPNVFTPNGDEFNSVFIPMEYNYLSSGIINVYNRWGNLLFSGDMFAGWNGKTNHGSETASGVYFFEALYTDKKGTHHRKKGTVTLSR